MLLPGALVKKIWRVRNTGTFPWPLGTKLVPKKASGANTAASSVPLTTPVPKNGCLELQAEFRAPEKEGKHIVSFQLQTEGKAFGDLLWAR